ncbi:acyltransferase [Nesterenkonia pannonica]|uniref:acyltransferase n=1 Tax=Nesterenkonia pannonica TaxID=1548602 RepID=UPI0021646B64|nr:acyltransferase [Nesterenkonia pannonica]
MDAACLRGPPRGLMLVVRHAELTDLLLLNRTLYYGAFFFLGAAAARLVQRWVGAPVAVVMVLAAYAGIMSHLAVDDRTLRLGSLYAAPTALAGIAVALWAAPRICRLRMMPDAILDFLTWCGRNSIVIYVAHFPVIILIHRLMRELGASPLAYVTACTVGGLIITLLIAAARPWTPWLYVFPAPRSSAHGSPHAPRRGPPRPRAHAPHSMTRPAADAQAAQGTDTRMRWMDMLRGLAVLLVVVLHAADIPMSNDSGSREWSHINRYFEPFRMPLLMLLSGMLLPGRCPSPSPTTRRGSSRQSCGPGPCGWSGTGSWCTTRGPAIPTTGSPGQLPVVLGRADHVLRRGPPLQAGRLPPSRAAHRRADAGGDDADAASRH